MKAAISDRPSTAQLKQIDLLLAEYEILSEDIRHLETAAERVFGVGMTLVSAFLAYAYKERIDEVYFVATPAYLGLLLYASNQWSSVFWKAGYKRHLQDRVNQLAGAAVLGWEEFAEYSRHQLSAIFAMFGMFLVIGNFAVFGISFLRISNLYSPAAAWSFAAVCGLLLLCLIFSVRQAGGRFERSYLDAKKHAARNAAAEEPK